LAVGGEKESMIGCLQRCGTAGLGGLALLILSLAPAPANAEVKLAFRNDGPAAVIVQGTTIVRGAVQRGKPLLVYPGKVVMWDAMPPGNALIAIADAKAPARAIYQGTITVGTDDLFFSVLPDVPAPKAKLEPIMTPIPVPPGR